MDKVNSGSAFPNNIPVINSEGVMTGATVSNGMTLLEWYAGLAMQGIVIAVGNDEKRLNFNVFAENAFLIADAMIAEKNKREAR